MKTAALLLRIGLAFSFVYAAISGFITPSSWIGFFPPFLQALGPAALVVGIWGVTEAVLALLILFMRDAFYPSLVAAALLFGVTFANWGAMDIVFRDVSIGLAALALAALARENRSNVFKSS